MQNSKLKTIFNRRKNYYFFGVDTKVDLGFFIYRSRLRVLPGYGRPGDADGVLEV